MTTAHETPAAGLTTRPAAAGANRPDRWQDHGRCAETDPFLFYPEPGMTAAPAKRVCMSCEVRRECLEYAVENGELWGVWGGTTENQRKAIRRSRNRRRDAA